MTCINNLKVLRTDNQRKALVYIVNKSKSNAAYKFNPAEISKAIGITIHGARKMLIRFARLGFLNSPIKKKFNIPPALQRTGRKGNKWSFYEVLNFTAVLDVVRNLFYKKSKPDCYTTNNILNNKNNIIRESGKVSGSFVDVQSIMDRNKREYKKKNLPIAVEFFKKHGLTLSQIKIKLNELFGSSDATPDNHVSTSIFAFMVEPQVEAIDSELDYIESVIEDLRTKDEAWSSRQRGLFFALNDKRKKLFKSLRSLLEPVLNLN